MTFGPGITIQGGRNSFIESPNAAIVNQGTIAEDASRGVLVVVSPDPFSNAGRVTVGRGAASTRGPSPTSNRAGPPRSTASSRPSRSISSAARSTGPA